MHNKDQYSFEPSSFHSSSADGSTEDEFVIVNNDSDSSNADDSQDSGSLLHSDEDTIYSIVEI